MLRDRSLRIHVCAALWCSLLFVQAAPTADGRSLQVENKSKTAATSGEGAHAILVELFTSEGCSSCPPADAFLVKLDTAQPVPEAQLIVLSEHVDYWDHDGWKDPNSSPVLTERQAAYVSALGLKTPYTPQIIVDGTSEMRLGDPQQEIKVFQEAVGYPKILIHIGEVTVDGGNPSVLRAHIEADGTVNKHDADIYVAVALDHLESEVLRGENGGHHLTHVAVVQQLTKIGKLKSGQTFNETIQMKLKPGTDSRNLRIVAFVQESGPGRLLGAAFRRPAS